MFLPKKKKKKNRSLELFQISRQISFSSSKDKIRRGWKKNFEFTKFLKREKFENFVGIRLIRVRDEREGNEREKKKRKERGRTKGGVSFGKRKKRRFGKKEKKKKKKQSEKQRSVEGRAAMCVKHARIYLLLVDQPTAWPRKNAGQRQRFVGRVSRNVDESASCCSPKIYSSQVRRRARL